MLAKNGIEDASEAWEDGEDDGESDWEASKEDWDAYSSQFRGREQGVDVRAGPPLIAPYIRQYP